jgi:hypothetical protein
MQAHEAVGRVGQVRPEWQMGRLVGEQLGFSGQWQALEIVPSVHIVETVPPKRVGRKHFGQSRPQLPQVQVAELVRIRP